MSDDPNDRGLSRKHIMESIDKSLQRIGVDYLDIYFCHRWDEETPLLETIQAMDDLIHQGKILYWGTSEWTAAQIDRANELAAQHHLYPPTVEQPQFSLLVRKTFEESIAPAAQRNGMGTVVWSPLASGVLTGKYDDGIPEGSRLDNVEWLRDRANDQALDKVRRMKTVAEEAGVTRAELALAWVLRHEAVSSVITGATRRSQLESNLNAAQAKLSPDVLAALDQVFDPANED
jgi:aryl-alcohol dehydrogenase-like predicted oxidoreductase